jgi:hypothetical protein
MAGELSPNDMVHSTVTEKDGAFSFSGVSPGQYTVAIVELPNLQSTTLRKLTVEVPQDGPAVEVAFGVRAATQRLFLPLLMR